MSVVALVQYAFHLEGPLWRNHAWSSHFRVASIFSNPNALAAYLNVALAYALAVSLAVRDASRRALGACAAAVLLAGLFVTLSRGAWLGCLALVVTLAVLAPAPRAWLLTTALVAIGAMLLLGPAEIASRAGELLDPAYYRQSAESGRLAFWADAWDAIRRRPFIGVGPGMYGGSVAIQHGVPGANWVDNHFLKIAAETGLLGLAAFVALLGALLQRAFEDARRALDARARHLARHPRRPRGAHGPVALLRPACRTAASPVNTSRTCCGAWTTTSVPASPRRNVKTSPKRAAQASRNAVVR